MGRVTRREEREQSVGSKVRKRQGKEDMKEWPVGMNESWEDVSRSCLRINPTASGKQNTNTSNPAVQLPVLRQLKGNIIKMQMWPIYWGAGAWIEILDLCVCVCLCVFGVYINVDLSKRTWRQMHTLPIRCNSFCSVFICILGCTASQVMRLRCQNIKEMDWSK